MLTVPEDFDLVLPLGECPVEVTAIPLSSRRPMMIALGGAGPKDGSSFAHMLGLSHAPALEYMVYYQRNGNDTRKCQGGSPKFSHLDFSFSVSCPRSTFHLVSPPAFTHAVRAQIYEIRKAFGTSLQVTTKMYIVSLLQVYPFITTLAR